MPELPEVETVVRGLRQCIAGETITGAVVRAPKSSVVLSQTFGRSKLGNALSGRTVTAVARRGKNILITLTGGVTLWVHLKMTGRFYHLPKTAPLDRHDLVIIDFESTANGSGLHLRFNDYRRFGRIRLFPDDELWQQPQLAELGPEPLDIHADSFVQLCRRRGRQIKQALLDQTFIAGLGNIYADESLYAARLHPRRLTDSVSPAKLKELHGHIRRLLTKAIKLMGTSVDTYAGVNGQTGGFQNYLLAYDREGLPCGRCGRPIVREKIGSRSAHFCRTCQRAPKKSL
jgi:formamidopyrimidine-DNA glycosylase